MAIRTPNPCDGIVDERQENPPGDDDAQGATPVSTFNPEGLVLEPIFVEKTIELPTRVAGRQLTMVDAEFGSAFIPDFSNAFGAQVMHTPATYRAIEEILEGSALRNYRDDTFDSDKLDYFRGGLLATWYIRVEEDNYRTVSFINPPERGSTDLSDLVFESENNFRIPVTVTLKGVTHSQDENSLENTTAVSVRSNRNSARSSTSNYLGFGTADMPVHARETRFYDMYYRGEDSDFYDDLPNETLKNSNKIGFYPSRNKVYTDSVFATPLPYHKQEANLLNIPTYNVVDISLDARGFETEAFKKGKLLTEYQKPSIYRSYYEESRLENLNPRRSTDPCIPLDLIQKFPSDRVEMMKDANEKMEGQTETFIRVKIATPQGADNSIAQFIRNNKMDRHILDLITSKRPEYAPDKEVFTQVMQDVVTRDIVSDDGSTVVVEDEFTSNDRSRMAVFFNVNNHLLDKIEEVHLEARNPSDPAQYPLGYYNDNDAFLLNFEDSITSQIFLHELETHVKSANLHRSFKEIMSGKMAHSEIIAFRVEKADATNGKVLQNFYFCDSNEILEIDFIDNQVLKGKKYRYRIFAVNFVIATDYEYVPLNALPQTEAGMDRLSTSEFKIQVKAKPRYSIIETPYFEKVISVFDKPPMFPQVSFIPYQGVEDEISFLLQDNGGEVVELPIRIFEDESGMPDGTRGTEERDMLAAMSEAQDKNLGDMLTYGLDDLPTGFQALCVTRDHLIENFGKEEPHSYTDFRYAEIKNFSANGKTAFYKMNIEPNKYYYIIFRTVEEEMISNPTEVYRFMMVSYANGIYFDVSTFELEKPKEYVPITFERVLKIEPIMKQYLLDIQPESESADDITNFAKSAPDFNIAKIGANVEESIWNKKLKFRIRSRSTNREIDLKVVFKRSLSENVREAPSQDDIIPNLCKDEDQEEDE